MTSVPAAVAAAWGWRPAELAPLAGGLINATYAVRRDGAPIAVVQRLHPTFAAEVNLDLDAVTTHLAAHGVVTPRLIRTVDDRAWTADADGRIWRALTWVDGATVHAVPDASWAAAGGRLVGEFHRAVADLAHDYRAVRAGVHDTAAHLAQLRAIVEGTGDREAVDLGAQVLDAARGLPAMPVTRRRHIHGDLKISNVLFSRTTPVHGICLVDLDTLGLGTIAFELGDAMRSWCNRHREDAGAVVFELPIFAAAIGGFRATVGALVSSAELASVVTGLETVCLELAARFAVDVVRDCYFGWDAARFESRRAHNLVRARGQLALGLAVRAARAEALDIVLAP